MSETSGIDEKGNMQFKNADEFRYVPDSELMNSSILRDQNFEENRRRMDFVDASFNKTKKFGFYSSLGIGIVSMLLFVFNVITFFMMAVETAAVNTVRSESEAEHVIFDFSGWLYSLLTMTVIAVCSMLVGEYHKKTANKVLYLAHIAYAVLGVCVLLGIADDMPWFLGIPIIGYSVYGFLNTDRSQRALKENDFLRTQEGYPEFNLAMYYMHQSKYVKMRRDWENREKKYDFFGEKERPLTGDVTESEDGMDGLSVNEFERDIWFENNSRMNDQEKDVVSDETDTAETDEKTIGELSTDGLVLPEKEYHTRDEGKYRPL